MGFDDSDYSRAAAALDVPVARVMTITAVESSGETFWVVDNRLEVPRRFEAHWFGKLTGHRFDGIAPDLSCRSWRPELAAKTRAGAIDQVRRACDLDMKAALCSTSWGAFQVMGFHWPALGYAGPVEFVGSMSSHGDNGQMDAFVRFVDRNDPLQHALRVGDWDTVETLYNGGGYGGAYAAKCRSAEALYADPSGTGSVPAPRVLRMYMRGADVLVLQRALNVVADGEFGPATNEAVRQYQRSHGLVVDGVAGTMTLRALGIAI